MASDRPRASGSLTIVCSDCSRNGKTLFAKLAAGLLRLRHGAAPTIFDTDFPEGSLVRHFPENSSLVDLTRTPDQVRLFDGILSSPAGSHFLIDLSARYLRTFGEIVSGIGFQEAAQERAIDAIIYFLIDRKPSSIEAALRLNRQLPSFRFVPVRNEVIGDALEEPQVIDVFNKIRAEREIMLPALTAEALGLLEHPGFQFDPFLAGHYENLSFEMRAELWGFMEALYEQRRSQEDDTYSAL